MARQLKVFSTPAGFFNAMVAAPSRKAALEAWGLRENVFANGSATIVTDPELITKALETPGEIVRVPVGSDAAILAGVKRRLRLRQGVGNACAHTLRRSKGSPVSETRRQRGGAYWQAHHQSRPP